MIDPETNALLFMDFSGSKTYKLSLSKDQIILEEVEKDTSESCFSNIKEQQESMNPELPIEQIYEILNTEKKLSEQNNNHIFRRKSQL
jgi:hypothetical protein